MPAWTMKHYGILSNGWSRVALPCACGKDGCEGWQMVFAEWPSVDNGWRDKHVLLGGGDE